MSLNEPGVPYDTANASDFQDTPITAGCDPDAMLWQEKALKTRTDTPNLTLILNRTGYQYQTTLVQRRTYLPQAQGSRPGPPTPRH